MCKLTSPIFMNHKQAKILAQNVKAIKGLALQYSLAKIKIYSKILVLNLKNFSCMADLTDSLSFCA